MVIPPDATHDVPGAPAAVVPPEATPDAPDSPIAVNVCVDDHSIPGHDEEASVQGGWSWVTSLFRPTSISSAPDPEAGTVAPSPDIRRSVRDVTPARPHSAVAPIIVRERGGEGDRGNVLERQGGVGHILRGDPRWRISSRQQQQQQLEAVPLNDCGRDTARRCGALLSQITRLPFSTYIGS